MNYPNYNVNDDVNTRLAKLERQVNRLEHRLSVLEQNNTNYTTDDMDNNLGNMYMV
jgi:septation ring formation regulator EzrA